MKVDFYNRPCRTVVFGNHFTKRDKVIKIVMVSAAMTTSNKSGKTLHLLSIIAQRSASTKEIETLSTYSFNVPAKSTSMRQFGKFS